MATWAVHQKVTTSGSNVLPFVVNCARGPKARTRRGFAQSFFRAASSENGQEGVIEWS